jgi:serine/threonine protein kinase
MGVVYRAEDRLTRREVALKRVLAEAPIALSRTGDWAVDAGGAHTIIDFGADSVTDAGALALAHEFRFLASLRHPNIISVLDFGFDAQNRPYFTMDWLPNARDILVASESLDADAKADLLIQLLRALVYLHRRGIVHRDLNRATCWLARTASCGCSTSAFRYRRICSGAIPVSPVRRRTCRPRW